MRKKIFNMIKSYQAQAFVALATLLFFAQTAAGAEEAADASQKTSLFKLVFIEGGFWMYVIIALSFAMLYFIIMAFLEIKKEKFMPELVVEKIGNSVDKNDVPGTIGVCEETPCMITRILAAGLRAKKRGKEAMEETLAEHGAREASAVRTKISYLNTIATIAPMLGLLGTVSGMIKAFGNIATMGMGQASVLASNISEALITTAGGLVIAIPAMALFFFFRNRVNDLMVVVEDQIGDFIDKLENQE